MPIQQYEVTFVVNPTLSEEDTVAVAERVTQTIATRNGTVTEITPWGKRRLAYPINHLREGSYVTISFEMETTREAEIEPALNLIEPVMRHVVVRLDNRKKAREQRARVAAQRAAAQKAAAQQAAAQQAAAAQSAAGASAVAQPEEPALDLPDDVIPPAVVDDVDAGEEEERV